jgi:hypothetical protein
VNISLPDALVCLIPTFFTSVFFAVVPGAKQKLAVASNVSGTIMLVFSVNSFRYSGADSR